MEKDFNLNIEVVLFYKINVHAIRHGTNSFTKGT